MRRFGHTRSAKQAGHLLHTPDAFVRAPLPGMRKATAVVHAAPAIGAGFLQYTAEFEAGGTLGRTLNQRFLYVLEGKLEAGGRSLTPGEFVYLPPASERMVKADTPARAIAIEKAYEPLEGIAHPQVHFGCEKNVPGRPLMDDPWIAVRPLLPENPSFDFAVNTMTFEPGASLPMVEVHVMEHGLLMLEGGGIYRLGEDWYPVTAGDFIWMAPYLPQWFCAIGKTPAKYLIYKDWNR